MFEALARTKAYADPEARTHLLRCIEDVSRVSIKPEAIDGSPCVRLSAFAGDRCANLLEIFDDASGTYFRVQRDFNSDPR